MKIYADNRMLACGLIGGTLSRHSGNMRHVPDQAPIYKALGIDPAAILHFQQVHGTRIITVSSERPATQPVQEADAWLFAPLHKGFGAAIVTADCVPLFMWDNTAQYAALAHCGWRGVAAGLPGKVAAALCKFTSATTLYAWLGPHIQACCFEVQAEVARQFPAPCVIHKNDKLFVDLTSAITAQLEQTGLKKTQIHAPYYCTCGERENFFSWRRDHQKNLMLSFIYKP